MSDAPENKPAPETFDAEYVGRLRKEAADARAQAKANAEAASELAALRDSQKTESQRNADQIKELQAALDAQRLDSLRSRVAARHGISPEDADLLLTGVDEATLTRQAERLAAGRMDPAPRSPREGTRKPDRKAGDDDLREFSSQLHNR